MAGTKTGGRKAAANIKRKFGDDFYARIGAKGGAAKNSSKGWGTRREFAAEDGAKGGRNGKPYTLKPRPIKKVQENAFKRFWRTLWPLKRQPR